MVKALIELDEETNRTLNIIKAKHGFRDKGMTIAYIVRGFKTAEEPLPLKRLHDGDKWQLAEDIPDVGISFMRVPFYCFTNGFSHLGGKAYKKVLAIMRDYHLWFYFGEKDAYEVGEHLANRIVEEEGFADMVNKEIVRTADELVEFCKSIPERRLEMLSDLKLWELFLRQDSLHKKYYEPGWIPVAADMFHNNLTNKLKQYLKSIHVPEDKVNEYMVILTQPRGKSLIQLQREELLNIALDISKDHYHKKLCEILYQRFQEQDASPLGYQTHTKAYEELLEKRVGELIGEMKPAFFERINNHYKKYFYVNRMWIGESSTFEYFLKEIVKLIGNHADIKRILDDEQAEFERLGKQREDLLNKLSINKQWHKTFLAFGDFMVTKIHRRYAQIYANYKNDFLLEEIGRRNDLTLKQMRFTTVEEVRQMLLEHYIDREAIKNRLELSVYYTEEGVETIFTGIKARQLAEEAEHVEVEQVSEIKGQVGCVGHAQGIVKKIIRAADMHKMNKGDILVSIATDPDIVSAMKKAAAIVTEQGGVTSHAAIVSREMNIPCVIGTKIATKVLHDGDLVEVDARQGIVKVLKRADET